MKSKLLLISLLIVQFTNAQNIVFADPAFNSSLVNLPMYDAGARNLAGDNTTIDLNNDNQISVSEAANISQLYIRNENIVNLQGIEFFTNLKIISLYRVNVANYDFSTLVNLESFDLSYDFYYGGVPPIGAIASINLSNCTNLKTLSLLSGQLTSLDLSNNTKLEKLSISQQTAGLNINMLNQSNLRDITYYSPFTTNLDLVNCTGLLSLNVTGLGFTFLDLSGQQIINSVAVGYTAITNLNFSNNTFLENIYINSNSSLAGIDFGAIKDVFNLTVNDNAVTSLNLNNLIYLDYLICDGNPITSLQIKNVIRERGIILQNVPLLQSICTDAEEVIRYKNICNNMGMFNVIVNDACNLPAEIVNKLLKMSPNPVQDMVHFESSQKIDKVEVFGINGLMIMSEDSVTDTINMTTLQKGMYFLKVYQSGEVSEMKFIKS